VRHQFSRGREYSDGGVRAERGASVSTYRARQYFHHGRRYSSPVLLEPSDEYYECEFPKLQKPAEQVTNKHVTECANGADVKRFVSFYLTNVPESIPNHYLR